MHVKWWNLQGRRTYILLGVLKCTYFYLAILEFTAIFEQLHIGMVPSYWILFQANVFPLPKNVTKSSYYGQPIRFNRFMKNSKGSNRLPTKKWFSIFGHYTKHVLMWKMRVISPKRLCKLLKWILIGILALSSVWFMSDVWNKFQAKNTSFLKFEAQRFLSNIYVLYFIWYSIQTLLRNIFPERRHQL